MAGIVLRPFCKNAVVPLRHLTRSQLGDNVRNLAVLNSVNRTPALSAVRFKSRKTANKSKTTETTKSSTEETAKTEKTKSESSKNRLLSALVKPVDISPVNDPDGIVSEMGDELGGKLQKSK